MADNEFRAVDHTVNVIGLKKNSVNYVMCCAWAMMVDYDKIMCLIGEQSVTGKVINKGDIIGFSALESNQNDIALALGDGHSDEVDKLKNIEYFLDDTAILIKSSKTIVKCEVIDILHLDGIENDNLLYLKMISYKENEGEFLHSSDL